ncbi:MAG: DNA polymerase/3'-5' exonuclease PolX [Desulfohalobiaceae bacterium]|nr:DNA polymerase/3'-5' exonuclease PolX [Desulfohalobiaceae bacterium]
MPVHNSDLEEMFTTLADLLEIEGANQYRVRAYRNAARIVGGYPRRLADMVQQGEDLTAIQGVGKELAGKIEEAVRSGDMTALQKQREKLPSGLLQLLDLEGLGPKKVSALYRELGITGPEDLKEAAGEGRIRELKGFGKKTEEKILHELEQPAPHQERRFLLPRAEEVVGVLQDYLRQAPGLIKLEIAGSFRRRKETVGDLDILVQAEDNSRIMEHFVAFEDVSEVLMQGETRTSVVLRGGMQVDLRAVPGQSFGAALHYFTGSKAHNIAVRKMGQNLGYKINEYGIYQGEEQIAGSTESGVYQAVGLTYIEPELREDLGELEASANGTLPELVSAADIRGDLHVHSHYSDGAESLRDLALAAGARGYAYLAVTDHSQRLSVARGLGSERLLQQLEEIDKVNAQGEGATLLKGIEVDILPDGGLDLPEDVLRRLDLVVCAIHSGFNLSGQAQTERLLAALEHPCCSVLAHPTGRMLQSRSPYDADMERVIRRAAERGVILEINSQPDRLDLSDVHIRMAREAGARMVICTDAHNAAGLDLVRYGVDQARRGWLKKSDVANTLELAELRRLLSPSKYV